ncbi:alpha-L-arabinofuranosidase C-terminal domain-containing protein [Cellulomonas cellasea]|uniref:alpha-L-arabinofuranosidase C-terminal domain-containing protein n=1 Tax=Cellulomonas cellasea TaxID=43670 RepID=UPI0025A3F762|nr:alpha-L-arabinofuranosidase C-terminal domain-containing protein [Cellulomonas cellasea]MDM8085569.1 alpha-L-arabinofuranosidase C-terminal domain-containing protein [Cellulomonas cellasea]
MPRTDSRPVRTALSRSAFTLTAATAATVLALTLGLDAAAAGGGARAQGQQPGAMRAAEAPPSGVIPAGAWVDDFSATTLGTDWSVHDEEPDALSLTSNPGALTLNSLTGDTWQTTNTARNIVLVDVPAGDFTAITQVTAPVVKDFQGAGLIAWQDQDNYVRAGLSHVGFAAGGPVVVENGFETAAVYSSSFTARPGSTSEILRLERVGDTITTSYWADGAWATAATVEASFPVAQIGLYALAAQDGTRHQAVFDWFALVAPEGEPVVPAGEITLRGPGDLRNLVVAGGHGLALAASRGTTVTGLTVTGTAADGVVRLAASDGASGGAGAPRPVVVADGALVLGAAGATPADLRFLDAGGGRLVLEVVGPEPAYVGVGPDGVLVVGGRDQAVKLTFEAIRAERAGLAVDATGPTLDMSDDLYGVFYEDINRAADGGLYAELVQNRSFEYSTADNASYTPLTSWQTVQRGGAAGTVRTVDDAERLNEDNRVYLQMDLTAPGTGAGAGVGVRNAGYNSGVHVEQGKAYRFSAFVRRTADHDRPLTVRIEDVAGTQVLGEAQVVAASDTWTKVTAEITATATTDAGRLAVLADGTGTVRLDMVSLFPVDTFRGRENGLRKDLAELIEDMSPQFVRFPGGCVTNVGTFDPYEAPNYDRRRTYRWKETIGPVEERPTNYNFWGYNQSYGLGYLEYFQLAEDLGAEPLPVVSVGVNGCGGPPPISDPEQLQEWIDDTLDLVEFANGGVDTEWGAVRASLGHPEPFGLEYLGLGNEEVQREFLDYYPQFADALKAAYPDLKIISNSGQTSAGAWFEELWDFARDQGADLVDEHYYNSPEWFLANTHRYDDYDRAGPQVFIGEYASRGNTFRNALAEAAFMTGIERNSDVIDLASYAPLLANEDYVQWSPDAIWFDNVRAYGSANYHVQKLFATNQGDQVLSSTLTGAGGSGPAEVSGGVGLSTWRTQAAYDNLRVTDTATGDVLYSEDFASDAAGWTPTGGTWAVTDGEYRQTNVAVEDARSTGPAAAWTDYTLELDARKIAGDEGFLVMFGVQDSGHYYWWNLGGWNNTRSAIQQATGGAAVEVAGSTTTIETGRTYRVKIEVAGTTVRTYLDGTLVTTFTDTTTDEDLHHVVTRDQASGDTILKVVNSSPETIRSDVRVDGAPVASTATVTEMTATSLSDRNTMADPDRVVPVARTVEGISQAFAYDFPAQSITFIRLAPGTVEPQPAASTTTVLVLPDRVRSGQPALATVHVRAARPAGGGPAPKATGRVRVQIGDRLVGEVPLWLGLAIVPLPRDLPVGSHTVTAAYLGSATVAGSTGSDALTVLPKGRADGPAPGQGGGPRPR